jgi:3-deoxy-manno-octulosonate cytidylyltransferase (CMP-KDO synthetase)
MVVRVCERAQASGAQSVTVATDDARIGESVSLHGYRVLMTRADHASGTDRIAEAAAALGLKDGEIVVNVQGDEPLIEPALVREVADTLARNAGASMSTACHAIHDEASFANPNVVKVVLDAAGFALYFSRAGIPYPREGGAAAYRHVGIYGYRVAFLSRYSSLPISPLEQAEALEQLRALWNGFRIAVCVHHGEVAPGVDTPQDLAAVRKIFK